MYQLIQQLTSLARYVLKQPRIESVASDVRTQLLLLQSIIDGELEEEEGDRAGGACHMLSLTQVGLVLDKETVREKKKCCVQIHFTI